MIARLRFGLNDLRELKFKQFSRLSHSYMQLWYEVQTGVHYLHLCPNNVHEIKTLLDNIESVLLNSLAEYFGSFVSNVLLFGETFLDDSLMIPISMTYLKFHNQL